MLVKGNTIDLLLLLFLVSCSYYFIQRGKRGWTPNIRRLPTLDAIDESIQRGIEMDKPIIFTPGGVQSLTAPEAPQTIASLSILNYVARRVARLDARMHVAAADGLAYELMVDVMRNAFMIEGKRENYREDYIKLYTGGFFVGVSGLIMQEKPAATIFIGPSSVDTTNLGELTKRQGGISIGGTARTIQIPFLAVVADYMLIGEEIYAAGAYLSGETEQTSTIVTQDIGKIIALILLLIGGILATFGTDIINILKM